MTVEERFLKYIAVDTTSDPSSDTFPSTKSQLDFAAALREEIIEHSDRHISTLSEGYRSPSESYPYKYVERQFFSEGH